MHGYILLFDIAIFKQDYLFHILKLKLQKLKNKYQN